MAEVMVEVAKAAPVRRAPSGPGLARTIARILSTPAGIVGLILTAAVLAVALLGPFFAPYTPLDFQSVPFDPRSADFPLGTDVLGRDVLSRVLYGGRTILALAALSALIAAVVGAMFGVWAAYSRGVIDEVIMRTTDVALAFPQTILALLLLSVFGPELWLVVLVVALIHAPQVARVARAASLRIIEEDYVAYAELIGSSRLRVVVGEIIPNILSPMMVELGLRFTYSVAIIAGLNFLGFGVQPPNPDWGLMINENRIGMESNPWPVVVPIVLLGLLTIGVNLLTDAYSRFVGRSVS